jgi:UDP-glucose 4-epimerase
VNELFETMKKVFNIEVKAVYKEQSHGSILHSCLDNTLAKEFLEWDVKFDFRTGVRETINYYRNLFISDKETRQLI